MARSIGSTVENSFINGHVTEATALNFPESASVETENCVFNVKGNITRRHGIDFENGFASAVVNRTGQALNSYYWKSAGGSGIYNFLVVQAGFSLYIYNASDGKISPNLLTTLDLSPYTIFGFEADQTYECQFASGKGFLFVAHPYMTTVYIEYNTDTSAFTINDIVLEVRDLDGVEDGLEIDERHYQGAVPAGYVSSELSGRTSPEHYYNLCNQGWHHIETGGATDVSYMKDPSVVKYPPGWDAEFPVLTWMGSRNDLPSNADVWWIYKDAYEVLQPKLANANGRGNSPAPKGHYILQAFYEDRSGTSGISSLPVLSSGFNRPSTVAFFSGRVFYSGVNSSKFSNKIYFSQTVKKTKEFGRCYQENDPTSEVMFSLLATDGGVIQILDAGNITKLWALQNLLVVFATNGIWTITGSTGTGFTASDYSVNRISSTPILSASSFVEVAGMPVWWTQDGIYGITSSQNATGQVSVTSLSEKKNKSHFINNIPVECKKYAKGAFNPVSKVIQWVYKKGSIAAVEDRYEYDSVLCFNTVTQAFYNWTLPEHACVVSGIACVEGSGSSTDTEAVTSLSGATVTAGGITVTSEVSDTVQVSSKFKYLVNYEYAGANRLSFAEERDVNFLDFKSFDGVGVDAEAYTVSGFKVHGDGQKKWQTNYIYIFCDNSVTNKFYFQSIWDYHNDSASGEYGSRQLVGGTQPYKSYTFNRLKIRGMGVALQFKITSLPGQSFNVVGWSAFESSNARI